MGGQVILKLRHQESHDLVKLSRPHHSFEGITLVATPMLCRNINFVLPSVLTSDDINSCHDINFCCDISFCRDLVCTCPRFNDQTAFHFRLISQFSSSNQPFPDSNSNIYSIQFSQNLYREKNAPLFQIALSCELLELSWKLLLLA